MSKSLLFTDNGWEDYLYWQKEDKKKLKRINLLIEDVRRNGNLNGVGKPEALKGNLQGFYSRRIDSEHRLVYRVTNQYVEILQCRYHYS
ncbi:Txe/YoeB family addiction module toxin [Exiguobacterium sp. SL-10]|uniref:Txe/YoeB family addiction module toxin n=1 Tax=unclassified Exiguobacterium TaxID=2644629 RepID=UPI00103A944C|nr:MULTISPECIES: Txe/YoeB family addiction module toxin [unclassified Exiguobacterium]TCI21688.1 Txe/YoeB family addiction module toxin [Exiguobacterium sp. SL-9]TCI29677.1 Txe/YoeB family addiction module toxin [Exiguobacterium sp. SL-10]